MGWVSQLFCRFSLVTVFLLLTNAQQQDFQFENGSNDDQQMMVTEPPEEATKSISSKNSYTRELSDCPYIESKIMLSLVLRSHDWEDIVDNKKNRAVSKLSKFFAVPKDFIKLESVSRRDIYEMTKRSIKRGLNKSEAKKNLGKLEFVIGCGQSYFTIGEPISNQIGQQMKDGSIDDITGINFGWWAIWKKKVSNRVQRFRRDADASEGSGEDDYEYDYEDDFEESVTELPTETTHAHRHHHGASKDHTDEAVVHKLGTQNSWPTTHKSVVFGIDSTVPETTISSVGGDTTVYIEPVRETTSTTIAATIPSTTTPSSTTEYVEPEPVNMPPLIRNRLPKQPVTAGKPFVLSVPLDTFYDNEDGSNLRLEMFDKNGHTLKSSSWIQYNPEKREIYGLPLEDAVSRYQYKLQAYDSKNETVSETVDITVQQHKGYRTFNHDISIAVKLEKKFKNNVDWQIRLIRGIVETLHDNSMSSVVVREIRKNLQDPYAATFIYTNETLPKDKCPEEKLDDLIKRLDPRKLSDALHPEITVKSVSGQPIGPCMKIPSVKPKPTPHMTINFPPVPRNQVDRVNATIGQLLVYKVPPDTFYDPEDSNDLKLYLLTMDRGKLNPRHWLQFDSKNQEFYGIPKNGDYGREQFLLVAEDHEGLTATDVLVVEVNKAPPRDFSVLFKLTLGISYAAFNNSLMQRRFLERVAQLLGDSSPSHIQIRSIQPTNDTGHIIISFFNTTLHKMHNRCPDEEIDVIRNIWLHHDYSVRDRVRKIVGNEFNLLNAQLLSVGSCHVSENIQHELPPIKTEDKKTQPLKDDYILTFVLPAIIILAMVLLASIVACVLHRRRMTGKMELGDEEERRSFRSKGIPVIFQDELDEKPEIGNKSPIILKDEKPPLLPPSYNSTNLDGDNDVDEYVPPPAVMVGSREARGKSPVTPSYRKPPPYVSP